MDVLVWVRNVVVLSAMGLLIAAHAVQAMQYEVWAIDQSDAATGGAKVYIYDGNALIDSNCTATPEIVDLAAASKATGVEGIRPHMNLFNADHTHMAISHTASKSLLVLNAETRKVAANLPIDAHAAFPTPDDTFIIAADIGDKLITRIRSDYTNEKYTVEDTLDLSEFGGDGGTGGKTGPVCPIVTADSKHMYATLNGGGLLVVNIEDGKPMSVVDVYNTSEVAAVGCGGIQVADKVYINSATPDPASPDHVYVFDTDDIGTHPAPGMAPPPKSIDLSSGVNDSHGAIVTDPGRYVWFFNRDSNDITIIDSSEDRVVNTIPAALQSRPGLDLAADLADIAPNGRYAFASTRGPNPRTANKPKFMNAAGNRPGVAAFEITDAGKNGTLVCVADIASSEKDGVQQTDMHGLRVRIK